PAILSTPSLHDALPIYNLMIGGFIITTGPTRVVIRAIGPSLSRVGVPESLSNPQLELHDGGGLIGQNDDWETTQLGGIITSDQVDRKSTRLNSSHQIIS